MLLWLLAFRLSSLAGGFVPEINPVSNRQLIVESFDGSVLTAYLGADQSFDSISASNQARNPFEKPYSESFLSEIIVDPEDPSGACSSLE